jgi:hypothetical protein
MTLLLLQSPQTTSPHFLQWCFRVKKENSVEQQLQLVPRWSAFMRGAAATTSLSGKPASERACRIASSSARNHSSISNFV